MRPLWSGSISFGLVTIAIKLYSAVQQHALGFTLLCTACHKPISYTRECACDRDVSWSDVEKGFEYQKGKYFILTKEHIAQLKPAKSKNILIAEFVDATAIAPIYYENHYYAVPSQADERAYFLFNKVLEKTGKVAIGTMILREKQYVVALQAYDNNSLLVSTLNYAYEIRSVNDVMKSIKVPAIQAQELKLAEQLMKSLYKKKFDISTFKDEFAENLKALLKKYAGKLPKVKPTKVKEQEKIPTASLMTMLKKSL